MKQRYFKTIGLIAGFAALFMSCSSEEGIVQSRKVAIDGSKISISVAPYANPAQLPHSRAVGGVVKADTVMLRNGQRAVVSIEEDSEGINAAAPTRAMVADGHYTIYACYPGTSERVLGSKSVLTGTFSGGVFTPDAGSQMILDAGEYKFVCVSDAFGLQGNSLILNTAHVATNGTYPSGVGNYSGGTDALLGTTTETISGDDWKVKFTLEHQTARVRIRLVAYTDHLDNVHGGLSDSQDVFPTSLKYTIDGESPTTNASSSGAGDVLAGFTFPATSTDFHTTYVKAHQFMSNDMFICPGTKRNVFRTMDAIAGNIYTEAMDNISIGDASFTFQRNHSYTITYRLLPEFIYLFNDGSCGALAEKGSRTAIAAVVKEKTNTEEGTAVALHQATRSAQTPQDNFNRQSLSVADAMNDMNGYNYTWDAATTVDNEVKATAPAPSWLAAFRPTGYRYETFYYAGNYNPGVATSNIGKWYLPALGEWRMAIKEFAGVDIGSITDIYTSPPVTWDRQKMKRVFALAGGEIDEGGGASQFWESSTQNNDSQLSLFVLANDGYITISSESNIDHPVVPFVHF